MKKNLSSPLIHSVIKPCLVPRLAGGDIGAPSISHIFVHTQWKFMEVLEATFLAFVPWVGCAPKLCVVFLVK